MFEGGEYIRNPFEKRGKWYLNKIAVYKFNKINCYILVAMTDDILPIYPAQGENVVAIQLNYILDKPQMRLMKVSSLMLNLC